MALIGPTISAPCSMPVVEAMTRRIAAAFTIAVFCQPVLAWDYLTNGSDSIYAGHSTGQIDTTGTAALVFSCTKSAKGAVMFILETQLPTFAQDTDLIVDVFVGESHFPVEARTADAGGSQMAMTWGRHAAVNDAVRAIYETDETVTVDLGEVTYAFAGAARSPDFLKMLEACGRAY